jgi:hypothetical protein
MARWVVAVAVASAFFCYGLSPIACGLCGLWLAEEPALPAPACRGSAVEGPGVPWAVRVFVLQRCGTKFLNPQQLSADFSTSCAEERFLPAYRETLKG